MLNIKLIANIDGLSQNNVIGRIGGNIPECLLLYNDEVKDFYFYVTFEHPERKGVFLSVFTPKNYEEMVDNNIYPNCSIKVFSHGFSNESDNCNYTNEGVGKIKIVGYKESENDGFITVSDNLDFIQDEVFFYENLISDGYAPFIKIDEDYYPDEVISGSYIFGYGALYLYKHTSTNEIIAGFWQMS
ncbi:hypothetical protein [Morganella psychrotolerans]|uniref:DUF1963 domain-containing protein n=1 Tax=Morganella psychrotolerans TaxID=368603 RepID=A0A1B8H582_9GAMM|nr:hypothetical protein [Morganella psychrotolerans]OBU04248.1 hypothetical protein AYY18_09935 [Morganella psychrotolerans]